MIIYDTGERNMGGRPRNTISKFSLRLKSNSLRGTKREGIYRSANVLSVSTSSSETSKFWQNNFELRQSGFRQIIL